MPETIRTLVTAAPPTPNGSLHLGHLSGPYSGADILTRAERLKGRPARMVVGIDDHQSYVPTKALEEGRSCDAVSETYAAEIRQLFRQANFSTGELPRTRTSETHHSMTYDFFKTLLDAGQLESRTEPAPFCPKCERYLFEAYIAGDCPYCGEDSDGNSCEACARPNSCVNLVNPRCNLCGTAPELQPVTRLVFPLSQWEAPLTEHVERACMSPQLRGLAEAMLADGLPDIPITHPTDWGMQLALPGFEDQRVYVWAEMVPGYMSATADMAHADPVPAEWSRAWTDPQVRIVQFFGFDNGYFHVLLHPALLLAWREDANLPSAYVTNEFYELEGQKFSTSRRHAIWASEMLDAVAPDVVRFVLAADRPEAARTNFDGERFATLLDGELVGHWEAWLDDLLNRLENGRTQLAEEAGTDCYVTQLEALSSLCLASFDPCDFSPQRACRLMRAIVREGEHQAGAFARARREDKPPHAVEVGLRLELLTATRLAQLAAPVMPRFAAQLWAALGLTGDVRWIPPTTTPDADIASSSRLPFFEPPDGRLESLLFRSVGVTEGK